MRESFRTLAKVSQELLIDCQSILTFQTNGGALRNDEVLKVLEQSLACIVRAKLLCERSLQLRQQSRRIHRQGLELAERACGLRPGLRSAR